MCLYICRLKLDSGQNGVKWGMQQKFNAYLEIIECSLGIGCLSGVLVLLKSIHRAFREIY